MPVNLKDLVQSTLPTGPTGPIGPTGPTGPIGPTGTVSSTISNAISITDATASSNTTTGALTVAGGVGVAGTINTVNLTATGTTTVSEVLEKVTVSATAAEGTVNFDALDQGVLYYTSNAGGDWTLNVRGNSTTTLDSVMSTGQSLTVAFMVTNGATARRQTDLTVDGTSVTPKWLGGSAPSAGSANSVDSYSLTLIKTGAAAFVAFESFSKYA